MPGPFELALSQFAERAGERADKVVRDVVLEVASRVIVRSPVDTGRFRGNWRVSVDGPDPSTTEARDRNGTATWQDAARGVPAKAAGRVFYVQNNLPYALRLEYGYSRQAPSGIVRLTVVEFAGIVDKAATDTT